MSYESPLLTAASSFVRVHNEHNIQQVRETISAVVTEITDIYARTIQDKTLVFVTTRASKYCLSAVILVAAQVLSTDGGTDIWRADFEKRYKILVAYQRDIKKRLGMH